MVIAKYKRQVTKSGAAGVSGGLSRTLHHAVSHRRGTGSRMSLRAQPQVPPEVYGLFYIILLYIILVYGLPPYYIFKDSQCEKLCLICSLYFYVRRILQKKTTSERF